MLHESREGFVLRIVLWTVFGGFLGLLGGYVIMSHLLRVPERLTIMTIFVSYFGILALMLHGFHKCLMMLGDKYNMGTGEKRDENVKALLNRTKVGLSFLAVIFGLLFLQLAKSSLGLSEDAVSFALVLSYPFVGFALLYALYLRGGKYYLMGGVVPDSRMRLVLTGSRGLRRSLVHVIVMLPCAVLFDIAAIMVLVGRSPMVSSLPLAIRITGFALGTCLAIILSIVCVRKISSLVNPPDS